MSKVRGILNGTTVLGIVAAILVSSCSFSIREKTKDEMQKSTMENLGISAATVSQDFPSKGFHVSGSQLLDANDNPFVMRGVNHAHTWYKDQLAASLAGIAESGANTVRIVLSNGAQWTRDDADSVTTIIETAKSHNLITVLEVHDATGSSSTAELAAATDYFISIKDALTGQEPYTIINIANEWYPYSSSQVWADTYKTQIPRLRAAGLEHAIMVDAPGWGQYPQAIQEKGAEVLASDSLSNIIFSTHIYEVVGANQNNIKSALDGIAARGLAQVIGEFGHYHSGTNVDEDYVMSYATDLSIGYLAWSWKGNTVGETDYLDMSSDWEGNSLTDWGNRVVNGADGLKETAETASVFGETTPPTGFTSAMIDDYSNASSSNFSRNTNGNLITAAVSGEMLYLSYTVGSPAYAGVTRGGYSGVTGYTSDCDTVRLDLVGDGSGRELVLQFREGNGEYFEYVLTIGGSETVSIPVASFAHPSWYSGGDGKLDFSQLSEYSVYVQNGNAGSGTITLDNLQVGKASNEDPAALAAISVTSKSVYRSAGSVTLTAAGTDQHGDAYSLNGTVWSSNLPILGSTDSTVTLNVSSAPEGSYAVTAVVDGISGSGTVTVTIADDPPATGDLKVEYRNANQTTITNSIKPELVITNTGDEAIGLSGLTVRYWYSDETERTQNITVYWANVGNSLVKTNFVGGSESEYALFSFASGSLAAGAKIYVNLGINADNWANYDQSNDYSFIPSATSLIENPKITAYLDGKLAWGTPPGESITAESVEARISYSPSSPKPGETVTFNGAGSVFENATPASYSWVIEGTAASGPTTAHTFAQPGTYVVTLTATAVSGLSDDAAVSVTVKESDGGGVGPIDYGASENEDVGVVWASWNPAHFTGTNFDHFMSKSDEYGFRRVTLIPTYFIDTYSAGIRWNDWVNTPSLEIQRNVLVALAKNGVRINFRPHIDPMQFSWAGASSSSVIPGTLDWRGLFDGLDPMDTSQNYLMVIDNSLEALSLALGDMEGQGISLKEPIRFDIGAELMGSFKNHTQSWVELLAYVRERIAAEYPEFEGKVVLGHNFCHHIEYLKRIPSHEEYFSRILADGDFEGNEDLLFVDDMTAANKSYMKEYLLGLDAFSVSQYMPLDVFASSASSATAANVRDALLLHEDNFFTEILGTELGIAEADLPPFHIGEYGMGIRGHAAPNVWDREAWIAAGRESALIGYEEHQEEAKTAVDGLILYMKDSSSRANSFLMWMSGAPYDILNLNPTFSTGDSLHGYPGQSAFNAKAAAALQAYW